MLDLRLIGTSIALALGSTSPTCAQEAGGLLRPGADAAAPLGQEARQEETMGTASIIITLECGSGIDECEARADILETEGFICTSIPGGIECAAEDVGRD